jgi:cytochrome b pre-mRNA-processing protein 3
MILGLFRRDPRRALVETLYQRIVEAGREPGLYAGLGVPDTVVGRFEAVALHVILVLRRLRQLPPPADEVAQALVDAYFRHMDASLRESGVGDMRVPKRMKKLAGGFYGRAAAYDRALDSQDRPALAREFAAVLGPEEDFDGLAAYAQEADRSLAGETLDGLLSAGLRFPSPEGGRQ